MSTDPPLARLVTELKEAEQRSDDTDAESVLAYMERADVESGGLDRLVVAFGGSHRPEFARLLAFLLARAASNSGSPRSVARMVWSMVEALSTDDDATRANLLSAVQSLAMRKALPMANQPVPARLGQFLVDSLQRGAFVLDIAAPVLATLDAYGFLDRLDADTRQMLRDLVDRLPAPASPFTRADVTKLKRHLSGAK